MARVGGGLEWGMKMGEVRCTKRGRGEGAGGGGKVRQRGRG